MWNLFWDKNYEEVRDSYAQFGLKHQKLIQECKKKHVFPQLFWEELIAMGIYQNATKYRGIDGIVYLAAAIEGLCYGSLDGGIAISMIAHLGLGFSVLTTHAEENLKKKLLNKIINEGAIISFATTEPHGGSDPTKLESTVIRRGNYYILNGEKWCITNAPIADIIITFAREVKTNNPVSIVVEKSWAGVKVTDLCPIGLQSSPLGRINFNNVEVPIDNILGPIGTGLIVMNDGFTRERLLAPFASVGIMARVLDESFNYALNRSVFGDKIASHQFIKHRLTEMKLSLDTTQSLGHAALKKFIANDSMLGIASAAKMYASSQAFNVVEHAIKIYGSYGIQEGSIGDILTSVMAACIAGGTE